MALVNWTLTPTETQFVKDKIYMETATEFLEENPQYDWIFEKLKMPEELNVIVKALDVIESFGNIFPVEFKFCPYGQLSSYVNRVKAFDKEVELDDGIYVKDHFNGKYTLYVACEDNEMRFVDLIAVLKVIGAIIEVEHARASHSKPKLMKRKTSLRMAGVLLGADGTEQGVEEVVMEDESKKLVGWLNGLWISLLLGIEPYIIVNGIMEDEIDSFFPDLMTDEMWNAVIEVINNRDLANSMFKVAGEYYSPKHAYQLDVLKTELPVSPMALMKQIDRASLLLLGNMYDRHQKAESNENKSNVDGTEEIMDSEVMEWPVKVLMQMAMKEQNLTVQQVSEKSGVPVKTIELFMSELVPIQINDAILISKAINVDLKAKLAELKIALHDLTHRNSQGEHESEYLTQLIGMLGLELDNKLHKMTFEIGSGYIQELVVTARSYRIFMEMIQDPLANLYIPLETMDMSVFINASEVKAYHFKEIQYRDDYVTKGFDHLYTTVNVLYKQAAEIISFKVNCDVPNIPYFRDGNIGDCLINLLSLGEDDICTFETNTGEVIGISRAQVTMIAVDHVITHPHLIKTDSAVVH